MRPLKKININEVQKKLITGETLERNMIKNRYSRRQSGVARIQPLEINKPENFQAPSASQSLIPNMHFLPV